MAQEKFFTKNLFGKRKKIKISYLEIAKAEQVTRRTAINRVKNDIKNGFITKQATRYKCKKYKKLLDGRNIYRLTKKGQSALCDSLPPSEKKDQRQKEKELLAALKNWMLSPSKKRANIFQKVMKLCPPWWARDAKLLQKTLTLLKRKLQKGYRLRSPLKWISSVLKDSGIGFSRKQAKRCAEICSPANSSASSDAFCSSPYVAEGYANLKALARQGLDVSEESVLRLRRKGFDHLALAAKVLVRIQKKQPVENPNSFLNWLVSLKEPFSVFEKKGSAVRPQIETMADLRKKSEIATIGKVLEEAKENGKISYFNRNVWESDQKYYKAHPEKKIPAHHMFYYRSRSKGETFFFDFFLKDGETWSTFTFVKGEKHLLGRFKEFWKSVSEKKFSFA